jgi:hypothetical protein
MVATPEQVDQYLTIREARGFNSFYLMAMVHPGGYGPAHHAPSNDDGDPPFATPGTSRPQARRRNPRSSTAASSPRQRTITW